ncbi:hypothetical protein [Neorhizobium sp. DT-125]|uniref:hypothetical protein n=1 Tax=Neorhizobium sp. DT-125 TaxID=3396163 RepID=UPI003F1B4ABE
MAKKKNAVPKKVAGFKIPKSVRKSAALRALLGSDIGRDVLANAITAGAGAAAAVLVRDREEIADAGKKGARKGAYALSVATEALESAASAVMGSVKDSTYSLLPKDVKKTAKKRKGRSSGKDERPFASAATH